MDGRWLVGGVVAVVATGGCATGPAHAEVAAAWMQALPSVGARVTVNSWIQRAAHDPQARARMHTTDAQSPALARALRVIAAIDAPPHPQESEASSGVPRLHVASQLATPRPTRASSSPSSPAHTGSSESARFATLRRVSMSRTRAGVTLSLRGSGELVVGVASQPRSGIVRLVVDANVAAQALRARPAARGVRVNNVRRVGQSAFVTLTLADGWKMTKIQRTRSGASVRFTAPA